MYYKFTTIVGTHCGKLFMTFSSIHKVLQTYTFTYLQVYGNNRDVYNSNVEENHHTYLIKVYFWLRYHIRLYTQHLSTCMNKYIPYKMNKIFYIVLDRWYLMLEAI